ncbi:hypothetical protein V1506DRAFT_508612 [Lipomyces tetrasporus]
MAIVSLIANKPFTYANWEWIIGKYGYYKAMARAEASRQTRIRIAEYTTTRWKPISIINRIFNRDVLPPYD